MLSPGSGTIGRCGLVRRSMSLCGWALRVSSWLLGMILPTISKNTEYTEGTQYIATIGQ